MRRSPSRLASPLAFLAFLPLVARAQDPAPAPAPAPQEDAYVGRAFVFRADPALGRALGWSVSDAKDADVLAAVGDALKERVLRSGRYFEGQVAVEDGERVSVTFVGRMADDIEDFLRTGLTEGGRLELRVLATDAEVAAAGTTRADERGRLDAWRAVHPGTLLAAFRAVPRGDGGPAKGLAWVDGRAAGDAPAEPRLVLADRRFPLVPAELDPEEGLSIVAGKETPLALGVLLTDEACERLGRFAEENAGHGLLEVLDEVALAPLELATPPDARLVVDAGLSRQQLRELLFALAAPLPAPVEFVEFGKRPLHHVVPKAEDHSGR